MIINVGSTTVHSIYGLLYAHPEVIIFPFQREWWKRPWVCLLPELIY